MKFSISNIGWSKEDDGAVYGLMQKYGYSGLEIAPTRIFAEHPYDRLADAKVWSEELWNQYGFVISSMQSIWYGRQEKLFGTPEERQALVDYTKRAVDFAKTIRCGNLVFGCPRNRVIPGDSYLEAAVSFFREIGNYAAKNGTVIALEANPPIYHTNFINDTLSALKMVESVASNGFLLNLDAGTMIQNGEKPDVLEGKVHLINHVHISEPHLKPIEERPLHRQLFQTLQAGNYQGFISVEMGKTEEIRVIESVMRYVKRTSGT